MGTDRPRSITPPAIRAVAAKGQVMTNVISMLCELAVVGGAVYLRASDSLTEDHFMLVAGAALIGPAVSRVRGISKPVGTATALGLAALAIKKITLF